MTFRSLRFASLLALGTVPFVVPAQETTASEDERIEQLVRSEASEWYTPKDTITVGFRVLSSGANVRFGNLGSVSFSSPITADDAGTVARVYDNGFVGLDALRAGEVDANGNRTSIPGERYKTYDKATKNILDANGNIIGTELIDVLTSDSVSYTPGFTRVWGYSTPEQAAANPGYIGMSLYGARSEGESRSKKQGASGGVEIQFAHAFRKLGKHSEFSLVAGVALNSINSKTSGDVTSTLLTHTDYFSLNGQPAPTTSVETPYTGGTRPDGITESTVPLATQPNTGLKRDETAAGAATVNGLWQIKGAYFMMKVGPSIRTQFTERFSMNASAGIAGAYVGTKYTAVETMKIPVIGTTITDPVSSSDTTKFLAGYYADFNLEWAANDTLGIYGGLSAQKFGDYTQTLGERDALVDLGTSAGLRGGISIKF